MNKTLEYKNWLIELKYKIRSSQIKAAMTVNTALINFYWELGQMITEKQTRWGSQFLENLSKDLLVEFPDIRGLSVRNLKYCRQFYEFYNSAIGQQAVAQLEGHNVTLVPWGHNILIFTKSNDLQEARFYINQTIENNWSRDVLALQIKTNLYQRTGKAITNFKYTLPDPASDLAQQALKDPTYSIL